MSRSEKQSRRWIVVINNAFFADDDKTEIDITNTTLPLRLDYYNLSYQKQDDNKRLFDSKYVVHENTVVERPYFKNLESLHEYYKNLDDVKYAVYNYEQGDEKQTKHIQSFVIFKFGKRFETMKGYFPTYTTVFIISNISLYEQYTNIQKEEPTTWRAFLRRIHGIYRLDSPTDKEKLLVTLQHLDTTDEPYDTELVPITNDMPW
jgi:hypothetical protein